MGHKGNQGTTEIGNFGLQVSVPNSHCARILIVPQILIVPVNFDFTCCNSEEGGWYIHNRKNILFFLVRP